MKASGSAGDISVEVEHEAGLKTIAGTHLLVAVGRKAAIEGLNLEAGNVDHDGRHVSVGQTLRSQSNKKVWALGDVAGLGQFTHIAGWHASVFARRAFYKQRTKADSLPPPAVTYTSPEVAQLGLTEAEARAKFGDKISTTSFPFHENDRAIAEGKTLGEAKLIVKGSKILGAHVVGEGAGDIIQLASVAMSNGLKLTALTNFISPYPTRAEVIKRAASAHYTPIVFGAKDETAGEHSEAVLEGAASAKCAQFIQPCAQILEIAVAAVIAGFANTLEGICVVRLGGVEQLFFIWRERVAAPDRCRGRGRFTAEDTREDGAPDRLSAGWKQADRFRPGIIRAGLAAHQRNERLGRCAGNLSEAQPGRFQAPVE